MNKIVLSSILFLLGCSSPSLTVRTLYSSAERLPSVKMDTPDPTKSLRGREHILSIQWESPSVSSPILHCLFRFQDRSLIEKELPLEGTKGSLMYEIEQDLFRKHGSLVSYKISLMHQGKEIVASSHKLWVNPITITNE